MKSPKKKKDEINKFMLCGWKIELFQILYFLRLKKLLLVTYFVLSNCIIEYIFKAFTIEDGNFSLKSGHVKYVFAIQWIMLVIILVQVNYLADCSLEIFDDPSAVALLEVRAF